MNWFDYISNYIFEEKIIWNYKRIKSGAESSEELNPLPMCVCVAAASSNSISTSAQYVSLQKCYSLPSLVVYFLSNLTHKTKTGTANRCKTTNSNQPEPINLYSQSTASVRLWCAFNQRQPQTVQKCWLFLIWKFSRFGEN